MARGPESRLAGAADPGQGTSPERGAGARGPTGPRTGRRRARRRAFESVGLGRLRPEGFVLLRRLGQACRKPGLVGSVLARMDDQHDYRGWDLWLEDDRIATHLVNKWPENALKVVARGEIPLNTWTHVFVTYDGSSPGGRREDLHQRRAPGHRHRRPTSSTTRSGRRSRSRSASGTARRGSTTSASATSASIGQALTPAEVAELVGVSRALALVGRPQGSAARRERSKPCSPGG